MCSVTKSTNFMADIRPCKSEKLWECKTGLKQAENITGLYFGES